MGSIGYKFIVILLFILLFTVGIGIYYRKEIQDYFDKSPKIIYRNETRVKAFIVKKYFKFGLFLHGDMTIHAIDDPNETELYRIDWYQSMNMTLTRIKDKFVVSRSQRINQFSYSFKLFDQSITIGTMNQEKTDTSSFNIRYTNRNHKTSTVVLRSCKKQIDVIYRYFRWNVMWLDMTQYFTTDQRNRLNIEIINPNQHAYLEDKSDIFPSVPYPYAYNLYVLTYLPNEFYLTTLAIADRMSHNDCDFK